MKKTTVYTALYLSFCLASIVAALVPPSAFLFGYLSWSPKLPLYVGRLHPWVSEPAVALTACGQFEAADRLLSMYGHATLSSISVFLLFSAAIFYIWRGWLFGINSNDNRNLLRVGWILLEFIMILVLIYHFDVVKVEADAACDTLSTGGFFGNYPVDVPKYDM